MDVKISRTVKRLEETTDRLIYKFLYPFYQRWFYRFNKKVPFINEALKIYLKPLNSVNELIAMQF